MFVCVKCKHIIAHPSSVHREGLEEWPQQVFSSWMGQEKVDLKRMIRGEHQTRSRGQIETVFTKEMTVIGVTPWTKQEVMGLYYKLVIYAGYSFSYSSIYL